MSQDLLFWETSTCNSDGMNFGSLISEGKVAGWVIQGDLKRRIKEGRWEVSRDSFTSGGIWRPSHAIQHKFREILISSHSFPPMSVSNELQIQIFEENHLLIAVDKLNLWRLHNQMLTYVLAFRYRTSLHNFIINFWIMAAYACIHMSLCI